MIRFTGNVAPAVGYVGVSLTADDVDGYIANDGQAEADLTPMQAILIVTHIAHPEDGVFHRPVTTEHLANPLRCDPLKGQTADPGIRFLAFPCQLPSAFPRAPYATTELSASPIEFLIQVGHHRLAIHEPDFATFNPPVPLAPLDRIGWTSLALRGKCRRLSNHRSPPSALVDYPL